MRFFGNSYALVTHRRWAATALAFLYIIVLTGATVRLTGSGLGCPDWPSCHGTRPVPELEYHGMIEFLNRLVAFPTLIATVGAWVTARRLAEPRRDLSRASGLALLGVLTQIVVGGITVRLDLHPVTVSIHFLISILILVAASITVAAGRRGPTIWRARRDRALGAGLLIVAACVIVLGVLTTASGPHSGGAPGDEVARMGELETMARTHSVFAWSYAALVVVVTLLYRRHRRGIRDLGVLTGLVAVQIALGEWQYFKGLPWQIVLAHVANAALIWIVTVHVAFDALRQPQTIPSDDGASDSAHAPLVSTV